jgi:NAD(P) transhydrogenase subunit alpha
MEISVLTMLFTIFVLSCVIGYHVIWGVTPALHTPLMAVTNAISGIVLIAAMFVAGNPDSGLIAQVVGFIAVALASINIFGGFAITRRMLAMFKKKEGK